jgi:hypothetical protein
MTPMASAAGSPLSGGVAAAVQLQPEGLVLFQPATLTIEPATPIAPDQVTPIAWRNAGEGMIMYPPELGTSKLVLKLLHFSGYGAGISNDREKAAIALKAALSAEDMLTSREGALFAREWAAELAGVRGDPQFADEQQMLLIEYYELELAYMVSYSLRSFALELKRDDLLRCAALKAIRFKERLAKLGRTSENNSMAREIDSFLRKAFDILLQNAINRCENTPGPTSTADILSIDRQRSLLGIGGFTVGEVQNLAEKCASFELQFTSEMKGTTNTPGKEIAFTSKVSAKVPIKFVMKSAKELTGSGSGPIDYLSFQFKQECSPCTCAFVTQTAGSTFTVFQERFGFSTLIEFDFNEKENPSGNPNDPCQLERELRPKAIKLVIDPGKPVEQFVSATATCEGISAPLPYGDQNAWYLAWLAFHAGEIVIEDWELLGAANTGGSGGQPYARKVYDRSTDLSLFNYTEKTTLELFHRPQ